MAYKRCSKCRSILPIESFGKRVAAKDGHQAWCRSCFNLYAKNRRTTTDRPFGLEIEFNGSARNVHDALREEGLVCGREDYNHITRPYWKIVADSSVNNGAELVSPILRGIPGFTQLKKACNALDKAGVEHDSSTGLHLHLEARDLSDAAYKTAVLSYILSQAAIDKLVAAHRRFSSGSGSMYDAWAQREIDRFSLDDTPKRTCHADKYRTINVNHIMDYGTVEIRQHEGSHDFNDLATWVRFGQAILAYGKANPGRDYVLKRTKAEDLLQDLAAYLTAPPKDPLGYLLKRVADIAKTPPLSEHEGCYCCPCSCGLRGCPGGVYEEEEENEDEEEEQSDYVTVESTYDGGILRTNELERRQRMYTAEQPLVVRDGFLFDQAIGMPRRMYAGIDYVRRSAQDPVYHFNDVTSRWELME